MGVRPANETYRKSAAMTASTASQAVRAAFFIGIRVILGQAACRVNPRAALAMRAKPATGQPTALHCTAAPASALLQ